MGCTSSKLEVEDDPEAFNSATVCKSSNLKFEDDPEAFNSALGFVATYLNERGMSVVLATVGGAAGKLQLRPRERPEDIYFFTANKQSPLHEALFRASVDANMESNGPLGADWLYKAVKLPVDHNVQLKLHQDAVERGVALFCQPGLTVYEAPLEYAICLKLRRLGGIEGRRPGTYEVHDAAAHFFTYLDSTYRQFVSAHEIQEWAKSYKMTVPCNTSLCRFDETYRTIYNYGGIICEA